MVDSDTAEAILIGVVGVMLIQGLWLTFLTFTLNRKKGLKGYQLVAG